MSDWTPDPVYREALARAKTDYDLLNAIIEPLQAKLVSLKRIINATSDLLGEPIDEKYSWNYMKERENWSHAKRRSSGPTTGESRK